jgi:hypothetical protein
MLYIQRPFQLERDHDSMRVTTIFTDEADARRTVFVPPVLPASLEPGMDALVQRIECWCESGLRPAGGVLPWQRTPTQVVDFKPAKGEVFPRGFLAEFELDQEGMTRLSLSLRRIDLSRDLPAQVDAWTGKCYRSVLHSYRVLRPLWDLPLRVVLIC